MPIFRAERRNMAEEEKAQEVTNTANDELETLKAELTKLRKENKEVATALKEARSTKEALEKLQKDYEGVTLSSLKTKIALEHGIPYDLSARLQGMDEKTLSEDATRLASFFKVQEAPPLKSVEPQVKDVKDAPYRALLSALDNND